ncbi:MAG: T9SS type A sorting domain-containing protein, partial [Bacteroidota bacterium]
MLNRYLLLLCLLGVCPNIWGQGNLLLVGGGNEQAGGWSDKPYQWAIQQAPNHSVALLSLEDSSPWLANYFKSLGADSVANFNLQTLDPESEAQLIASLMDFDCWFFRDGSSKAYFEKLQNQSLGLALIQKYNQGGVIAGIGESMQLFSSVFYLPETELPTASACLEDIYHDKLVLRNDFLPFYRGFLFEARFSERGGLGHMLAALARWEEQRQEKLFGVGLDDKTALCLNTSGKGTVWGTGSAKLLIPDMSEAGFMSHEGRASIDSLRMVSLIHGQSFDFVSWTHERTRSEEQIRLPYAYETAQLDLIISGSNAFSENEAFLEEVLQAQGDSSLPILLISSHPSSAKEALASILRAKGVQEIWWLDPITASQNDPLLGQEINSARKLLFSGTDAAALALFLQAGKNGQKLDRRLKDAFVTLAFMGEDSRLAGKCYIKNAQTQYASYDGLLKLEEGLQLLKHTILVPNVFWDEGSTENNLTGLTYAMAKDSLTYGIWLPGDSWGHYQVDNGVSQFTGYGTAVMQQKNTAIAFAPQYEGIARNIIGYQEMKLSMLQANTIEMGEYMDPGLELAMARQDWISVYPNPFKDQINIYLYGQQSGAFSFQLLDEKGRILFQKDYQLNPLDPKLIIPVPKLARGVYILQVRKKGQGIVKRVQLLH